MKSSSLQSKTVRPGLMNYSFYRSDRHPTTRRPTSAKPRHRHGHAVVGLVVLMVVGFGLFAGVRSYQAGQQKPASPAAATQATAVSQGPQQCSSNNEEKHIIVSVGERHLWACQRHKVVYNSPVITGMEFLAADLTPRGTYQVSGKQTNVTLTGSDSTGSWNDPVYYWMPFLTNEHGTYGFHDATWRPNNAFGNIDPNSKDASHGCVELPLGASKWLYDWTPVGTSVTVKD